MDKIDLEIILREAFVAGYEFRTLKKDGGKGIDFNAWYKGCELLKSDNELTKSEIVDRIYELSKLLTSLKRKNENR